MIPVIEIPPLVITEWLKIQPFGILLAIGVLFGSWRARVFLERHDLDEEVLRWLGIRLLIWGFIMCHITNTLFYTPGELKEDPLLLLKVWQGISSYGGILGGYLAFLLYRKKFPGMISLRWVDLFTYALVPGYMFGRMGCAVVHDHIGTKTDFPLAVTFPDDPDTWGIFAGQTRHDLGLYEVPVLFTIWIFVLLLARLKDRRDGLIGAFVAVTYPVPRFIFEFLRRPETDPRYLGLTPAQYFSIILFSAGLFLFYKLYVKKDYTRATQPEHIDWDPPGGRPEQQKGEQGKKPAQKKSARSAKSSGKSKKKKKR